MLPAAETCRSDGTEYWPAAVRAERLVLVLLKQQTGQENSYNADRRQ